MKVELTGRIRALPVWILGYYTALITGGVVIFHMLDVMGVKAMRPDDKLPGQSIVFAVSSAVLGSGLEFRKMSSEYAFSPAGQLIMGVLIELGGLGAMVFGSLIVLNVSKTWLPAVLPGVRSKSGPGTVPTLLDLVQTVLLAMLTLQIVGTLFMLPLWNNVKLHEAMRLSLFHSISAVCNSGLSTGRADVELAQYRYSPLTQLVIVPLAVLGSLGFPVWADFWLAARRMIGMPIPLVARTIPSFLCPKCAYDLSGSPESGKCPECGARYDKRASVAGASPDQRPEKALKKNIAVGLSVVTMPLKNAISRHTHFAIACFATAYIVGTLLITLGILKPYTNDWAKQGIGYHREDVKQLSTEAVAVAVTDASLQSSNALTAGFPVVKPTENDPSASWTLLALTALGGSPGGTGGGVRTYVVGLLVVAGWAALRRRDPEATIVSHRLLRTAMAMVIAYLALVFMTVFLLSLTEPQPFLDVAFEGVSAASGGGLSRWLTPNMTEMGRWVDLLAMYLGRAGLLALAAWMMAGMPADDDGLAVG